MKNISFLLILSVALLAGACEDGMSNDNNFTPGAGRGGSMAQFTVYNGQLYLLKKDELVSYSLQNPATPALGSTINVGIDAETLFPSGGSLFIGSQNGMHIYSLADPLRPQHISSYRHVTSCDPVVVEGNYAYVTLRTDSPCQWGVNELQVLDVTQQTSPQLIYQMVMANPQGLAVNEGTLYVTNGDAGLTVLDVANPYAPQVLKEYPDFYGYDVIFTTNSLMMIGREGLVQYDPRDPANLVQLSVIPVEPEVQ